LSIEERLERAEALYRRMEEIRARLEASEEPSIDLLEELAELAKAVHERTWAALRQYTHLDEQRDWWPDFVRYALGKESAAKAEELGELKIIAE
jgi:hypothetical protein